MAHTINPYSNIILCDSVSDISSAWPDNTIVVTTDNNRHFRMVSGVAVRLSPPVQAINTQALALTPTLSTTMYFGLIPTTPTVTAAERKIYFRRAGVIEACELYSQATIAGTNENWSIYIRLNNTTDTLIQTVGAATTERVFTNASLSIAIASGDYIEIKSVNPAWVVSPTSVTFGGYISFRHTT